VGYAVLDPGSWDSIPFVITSDLAVCLVPRLRAHDGSSAGVRANRRRRTPELYSVSWTFSSFPRCRMGRDQGEGREGKATDDRSITRPRISKGGKATVAECSSDRAVDSLVLLICSHGRGDRSTVETQGKKRKRTKNLEYQVSIDPSHPCQRVNRHTAKNRTVPRRDADWRRTHRNTSRAF
jgi:hypothetical protein